MEAHDSLVRLAGVAVSAYLIGSVNLSILAAKLARVEGLRETGSGNPGVTNLYRVAGAKLAVTVLIADILKALLAVGLAVPAGIESLRPLIVLPYVMGNLFPLFHGFKGGKGVAATVGAMAAVNPLIMLLSGGVFFAAFLPFRRISVGSLTMGYAYPVLGVVLGTSPLFVGVAGVVAVILTVTHRHNILRLIKGCEPKLGEKH